MMEHYFELWGNKKMNQKEIAKVLGVKPGYVSYRIKRAMRIIKKIMEDKYNE
jgi:DNA-directed RNA polymerase specialized sigma subunit